MAGVFQFQHKVLAVVAEQSNGASLRAGAHVISADLTVLRGVPNAVCEAAC